MPDRNNHDGNHLLARFWWSASGFWYARSAWRSWALTVLLILNVIGELVAAYWLNCWNRDFFNALEARDAHALQRQAPLFLALAGLGIGLALISVWARMTTQRMWRQYLTTHLINYWLTNGHCRHIHELNSGGAPNPGYRVAEDARVATDSPIDLALALFSSVLITFTFLGILRSVGGDLKTNVLGFDIFIPDLTLPQFLSSGDWSLSVGCALLRGIDGGAHPAEPRMWPGVVVISAPGFEYGACMSERSEQRLIEKLVTQTADEGFDEGVLYRLARGDVMPVDLAVVGPLQDGVAGQLGTVVADDGLRSAVGDQKPVELAGDPDTGDRGIGNQRQALTGAVVDHDQDAHAAAVDELIGGEVRRRSFGHCGTSIGARVPKARSRARNGASSGRQERYRTVIRTQPVALHARRSLMSNAERR
jgi:hypothetical protein